MDPARIRRISPQPAKLAPPDIGQAVAKAMAKAEASGAVTAIVNDPQRDTDSRGVLAEIARQAAPSPVRILVACGSHEFRGPERRQFEAELAGAVKPDQIAWHDSRSDRLVSVAGVWRGHPWLLEPASLVAIGSVEPHYFAGFTGAHKTTTIGCAGFENIQANHARAMSAQSRPGKLDGNPVHEGVRRMLLALQTCRPVGAVNLLQVAGQTAAAAGGDPIETLGQLIPAADETFVAQIDEQADGLVLEVSGALGGCFYQAEKGIKNNEWAVRAGGILILKAPCDGGIGQDQFVRLLERAATYQAAADIVGRQGYTLGDHKAVRLRYLTDPACRGVQVYLLSEGIDAGQAKTLGLVKVGSVAGALSQARFERPSPQLYWIENAGNVCVAVRGPAEV